MASSRTSPPSTVATDLSITITIRYAGPHAGRLDLPAEGRPYREEPS